VPAVQYRNTSNRRMSNSALMCHHTANDTHQNSKLTVVIVVTVTQETSHSAAVKKHKNTGQDGVAAANSWHIC